MATPSSPSHFSSAGSPCQRTRNNKNWSRSGCLTCKKRRKKCDEQKPECGNCIKLGRHCEGYATPWAAPLSISTATFQSETPKPKRRKISGTRHNDKTRQSPFSESSRNDKAFSATSRQSTPESINTADSVDYRTDEDISRMMTVTNVIFKIEQSPSYNIARSPAILQSSESFYLQYHAELGSQLLSNLEIQRNPLNEVLIPRALSSSLLMNALCTLSAGHMSNRASSNQETLRKAEMTYYGKTLSGVRRALTSLPQEDITSPAYISSLEELIATIASLCKYEVVRGSVSSWRGHMEALQRLVTSCGGLMNLDRDIGDWLSGLLTYWQHMANLMNPNLKPRLLFCESIYQTPKVDLYLGCSEQIVKVCSQIADLRRVNNFTLLHLEIININDYLTSWSFSEQSFIIPEGITDAAFRRLEVVANCFRYAAFIFLHSTLERMAWPRQLSTAGGDSSSSSPTLEPTTWTTLHSLITFSKPSALQRFMSLLQAHPPDNHPEFSALTFPLFIAGCECEGPDRNDGQQFSLILDTLKMLERSFGVYNTRRAQELIESYWASEVISSSVGRSRTRRRHWLDLLGDMDWDLLLV